MRRLCLLNTFLIAIAIGIILLKEPGFSWSRWLRYEVSLLPFSPIKIPVKDLVQDEILRFAVIGDAHIGAKYSSVNLLRRALALSKENGAEFIVLIGDITDHARIGEFDEARKILEESGLPYYTVPGNHDAWGGGMDRYEKAFGKRYRRAEIALPKKAVAETEFNRAILYFLDSTGSGGIGKMVDDTQMSWLSRELNKEERRQNELVFVFQETYLARMPSQERSTLISFFCKQKVNGFFFANTHLYERFYQPCPYVFEEEDKGRYEAIPSFGSGAISTTSEFRGFLLAHYFSKGKFIVEQILLGEQAE